MPEACFGLKAARKCGCLSVTTVTTVGVAVVSVLVLLLSVGPLDYAGDNDWILDKPNLNSLQILMQSEGDYGKLRVIENPSRGYRVLQVGACIVGGYWVPNQRESIFTFNQILSDLVLLGPLGQRGRGVWKRPSSLLQIGLGVGQLSMHIMEQTHYDIIPDAVELFPDVTQAAALYFGFNLSNATEKQHRKPTPHKSQELSTGRAGRVFHEDAKSFLSRAAGLAGTDERMGWDCIVVDTWLGTPRDADVYSEQTLRYMKQVLPLDGILVLNWFGYYIEHNSELEQNSEDIQDAVKATRYIYRLLKVC